MLQVSQSLLKLWSALGSKYVHSQRSMIEIKSDGSACCSFAQESRELVVWISSRKPEGVSVEGW
jgi:hypothetical protein